MKIIILLSLFASFDLSGIVALLGLLVGLIGLYIKQIKDIQEIKLTMKRDKQDTDKEISLLKLQLDAQMQIDNKILDNLGSIMTNQAVFDEKITNLLKRMDKENK